MSIFDGWPFYNVFGLGLDQPGHEQPRSDDITIPNWIKWPIAIGLTVGIILVVKKVAAKIPG